MTLPSVGIEEGGGPEGVEGVRRDHGLNESPAESKPVDHPEGVGTTTKKRENKTNFALKNSCKAVCKDFIK